MTPAIPRLSSHLDETDVDGYLVDAAGDDSTQYYLSGYHAPDEFVTLYADGAVAVLVSPLEYTRAKTDSDADDVRNYAEFGYREKAARMDPRRAQKLVTVEFLADYGVESVAVPVSFPTGTADLLREHGVAVTADFDYVVADEVRAVKSDRELEHVRQTQQANEVALAEVEGLLERASVADGVLHLDGDVLTSERVRRRIERTLLEEDCAMDQCIVASGPSAARAHDSGSGPLEADVPIVVDVFPRHKETRYFGDVTRTFVKGEPTDQVEEWYDRTVEAYEAALDAIEAGVSGAAVNDAVCDVFEDAGYPTLRTHDSPEDGFFHSTGHGVGLDVHEAPYLAENAGDLEAGHVVTVEPGLYEQGTGGVRLEDLVVVTEDGYENLTDYPRDLRVV
ncbi:M24 family metallopeptidase [Halobacterium bonnevillei]|uniref:M24 family metallopeptidase n=1 Tax=Halobacterium bonnevillei TaxID=2692200 RepID=A0A6B0SCU6_9EURY|nr:Xaa-Pro peptidase family protein [Halobacterium bonnevillei]MXR19198.1 M24 family metallopeptidase [Halobacterium bonnevillei]